MELDLLPNSYKQDGQLLQLIGNLQEWTDWLPKKTNELKLLWLPTTFYYFNFTRNFVFLQNSDISGAKNRIAKLFFPPRGHVHFSLLCSWNCIYICLVILILCAETRTVLWVLWSLWQQASLTWTYHLGNINKLCLQRP